MEHNNFLHKKLPDLQKSLEVQDSVEKHTRLSGNKVQNSPEARLGVYMDRLEKIFLNEDEEKRKRNIELIRGSIHDAFVIKPEDVPESYFELQRRVARERGQTVEEIPAEARERMIQVIIEDQTKSLDDWIDYLSSDDATYPTWFKYFVFRNIVKLSQFDKELGKFKERTKGTTATFPDIYREALAQVADLYEGAARDKSLLQDPDFQSFLSKKFPTQYADAIQKTLEHSQEDREQIRGVWVKYEKGNEEDAQKLYKSLQGKGTGWCTAGQSTAQTQIERGDFYVYYSYDSNDNPSNPRLAIRMEGDHIGEVRGVLEHQQVEPMLQDALDEKLSEFGDEAEKYKKKSSDMRKLTALERKMEGKTDLTKEDLEFLFEVHGTIDGFGYEEDPRIYELRRLVSKRTSFLTEKIRQNEELTQEESDILFTVPGSDYDWWREMYFNQKLSSHELTREQFKKLVLATGPSAINMIRDVESSKIAHLLSIPEQSIVENNWQTNEETVLIKRHLYYYLHEPYNYEVQLNRIKKFEFLKHKFDAREDFTREEIEFMFGEDLKLNWFLDEYVPFTDDVLRYLERHPDRISSSFGLNKNQIAMDVKTINEQTVIYIRELRNFLSKGEAKIEYEEKLKNSKRIALAKEGRLTVSELREAGRLIYYPNFFSSRLPRGGTDSEMYSLLVGQDKMKLMVGEKCANLMVSVSPRTLAWYSESKVRWPYFDWDGKDFIACCEVDVDSALLPSVEEHLNSYGYRLASEKELEALTQKVDLKTFQFDVYGSSHFLHKHWQDNSFSIEQTKFQEPQKNDPQADQMEPGEWVEVEPEYPKVLAIVGK